MKLFPAALLAGLAVAVLACDDGAGPDDGACDGPSDLSIDAAGSPPLFTWTPSCGVADVEVIRLDNDGPGGPNTDESVWRIQASSNTITPPVTYGSVPVGATEFIPDAVLVSGEQYNVVTRVYDPVSDQYLLQNQEVFTRP